MSADYDYGDPMESGIVIPFDSAANTEHNDWAPIDLNDPQWDEPARPPDLHEFIYSGQRHLISGPPEATKTIVAYNAAVRLTKQGCRVAIIDFEMGARRAKMLLVELGATPEDIAHVYFVAPETPPRDAHAQIIAWNPVLVVLDASVGAFNASSLDDNQRIQVEQFANIWINPLWRAGIATCMIDHVTKNTETGKGWAIGSERKAGFVEVHIGLSVGDKKALVRGGHTTVQADVHKDKEAFLRRPTAYFIDIASDPETHALSLTYRAPEAMPVTEKGEMRPWIKMEAVSKWVAKQSTNPSKNATITAIGGKKEYTANAIEILVLEGYLEELPGERQAKNLHTLKPYDHTHDPALKRSLPPTSPDIPPTSPGGRSAAVVDRLPPTSPRPFKGAGKWGGGRDTPLRDESEATSPQTDEDEIQRLLDKYDDQLGTENT